MQVALRLNKPPNARLHNIVDMGLGFSGMIRLFEKSSKKRIHDEVLRCLPRLFGAGSEEEFQGIHASFCEWGTNSIMLAERKRKRDGRIVKSAAHATYGQIAKTLDVTLKVTICYCHLPDCKKSEQMSKWLNAAVDTKMMAFLGREGYREEIKPWPRTVEQVRSRLDYVALQGIVREHIKAKHGNSITPVQFDDVYWEALNRDMG